MKIFYGEKYIKIQSDEDATPKLLNKAELAVYFQIEENEIKEESTILIELPSFISKLAFLRNYFGFLDSVKMHLALKINFSFTKAIHSISISAWIFKGGINLLFILIL